MQTSFDSEEGHLRLNQTLFMESGDFLTKYTSQHRFLFRICHGERIEVESERLQFLGNHLKTLAC